jgi:hypothetical protein
MSTEGADSIVETQQIHRWQITLVSRAQIETVFLCLFKLEYSQDITEKIIFR